MEALFMKRHLLRLAALAALSVTGLGFAQTDSHNVTVRIPSVLQVRITDGASNAASAAPAVEFDFQDSANTGIYFDAVAAGGDLVAPTDVVDFGDIKVFSNRNGTWNLSVVASALNYTNNLGLNPVPVPGITLSLTDIMVEPSSPEDSSVTDRAEDFSLSTSSQVVAQGTRTTGWASVGISGEDYALNVDGDEDPGQYVTTVTYTITMP
jgi:hypothetical protein